MHYYHFVADTPFVGTEQHYFLEFEKPLSTREIDELCDDFAQDNAGSYSYLITGWDVDEVNEDELNDFIAESTCYCDKITDLKRWKELQEEYA